MGRVGRSVEYGRIIALPAGGLQSRNCTGRQKPSGAGFL